MGASLRAALMTFKRTGAGLASGNTLARAFRRTAATGFDVDPMAAPWYPSHLKQAGDERFFLL
jgi:hypothetical protein